MGKKEVLEKFVKALCQYVFPLDLPQRAQDKRRCPLSSRHIFGSPETTPRYSEMSKADVIRARHPTRHIA